MTRPIAIVAMIALTLWAGAIARAQDAPAPTPPSDQVLDAIQARLDTFKIRDDGRHFTPRPGDQRTAEQREKIQAAIAALDAGQMQATGIVRLEALILTEDDLRLLAGLTGIRSVFLSRCTITADGFARLADAWHGSLNQLGLSYVDIDGGGTIAPAMGKLDKLTWMAINATRGIGMDVIDVIGEFPIEMLDMNRPSRDLPAAPLFEALTLEFKSLRKIDLHHWQKHKQERAAFLARRPEVTTGTKLERHFKPPQSEADPTGSN